MGYRFINHAGCWQNTIKICKSRAAGYLVTINNVEVIIKTFRVDTLIKTKNRLEEYLQSLPTVMPWLY